MALATAVAAVGVGVGAIRGGIAHGESLRAIARERDANAEQQADTTETADRLRRDAEANAALEREEQNRLAANAQANNQAAFESQGLALHNQQASLQSDTFDFLMDLSAESLIAGGALDASQGSSGFGPGGSQADQAQVQDDAFGVDFDDDGNVTVTGGAAQRALDNEADDITNIDAQRIINEDTRARNQGQITAGLTANLNQIDTGVSQYIAGVTEQETQALDALGVQFDYLSDTYIDNSTFLALARDVFLGGFGEAPAFADSLGNDFDQGKLKKPTAASLGIDFSDTGLNFLNDSATAWTSAIPMEHFTYVL